ncbi:MAG: hypothetical protein IJI39_02410 [Clostridia bacterium]|nr:hypothetical protein [Clostridia bacterium]MBQ6529759.1 hypothetical protein [Clostridia bacterium]
MDQNSKKTESVREFLASLKPEADEVVRLLAQVIVRKMEAEDEQRE